VRQQQQQLQLGQQVSPTDLDSLGSLAFEIPTSGEWQLLVWWGGGVLSLSIWLKCISRCQVNYLLLSQSNCLILLNIMLYIFWTTIGPIMFWAMV
jgi:hypothetical protein